MTSDDTASLDLSTMDALRGADDVRRRLLLEMNTGTPAISDLAYAVNAHLVEASRIYSAMIDQFPEKPAPLYRLAKTLDELGDKIAATAKFQAAVDALAKSDLAPDHWLRGAAPRLLGFSVWERAIGPLQLTTDPAEREHGLREVLLAIDHTRGGLSAIIGDPLESPKSRNNLLWFCLDYRESGGDADELLKRDLGDDRLAEMVAALEGEAETDVSRWDTVRHTYQRFGNMEKAVAAARKVLDLLESPDRQERWSTNESIVSRAARQTIETNEMAKGEEKTTKGEAS